MFELDSIPHLEVVLNTTLRGLFQLCLGPDALATQLEQLKCFYFFCFVSLAMQQTMMTSNPN